jgi:hypothetical protein
MSGRMACCLFTNYVEVEFSELRFHHPEKLCTLHPHIILFPRPSTPLRPHTLIHQWIDIHRALCIRTSNEQQGPTPTKQLEPPGFMALNYGRRTPLSLILAHLVYGGILGAFYRLK